MNMTHGAHLRWSAHRRAFTLTELLVVIAILAVLSALTVIAVRGISRSARLSSATNTVTAALDTARAIAMRDNKLVLVAFRAKPISETEQVIEAITAEFSGSSYRVGGFVADRFIPVADVAARELPRSVKVGAPFYATADSVWEVNTDFRALRQSPAEAAGAIMAVMFGPDGTTVTDNSRTDSNFIFIDYNNDGLQRQNSMDYTNLGGDNPVSGYCDSLAGNRFFCQAQFDDEPYVTFAPFLVVFDDEQAREELDTSGWSDSQVKAYGPDLSPLGTDGLTAWISLNSNRIHFNRYSGVVMK